MSEPKWDPRWDQSFTEARDHLRKVEAERDALAAEVERLETLLRERDEVDVVARKRELLAKFADRGDTLPHGI